MSQFKLSIALPENDFPPPIRFVRADIVIYAVDLLDATDYGNRLLAEWRLAGMFALTVTEITGVQS